MNFEKDKEIIIKEIIERIKEEQKKYEKYEHMDWYEIAARKIYSTFNIKLKPF